MRTSHRARALAALLVLGVSVPLFDDARGALAAGRPTAAAFDKALVGKLQSGDAAVVLAALGAVRDAGAAAAPAAPAVEQLLAQGATVEVARAAMEALAAIGLPSASAVVRPYVAHRVAELRRQAVKALARTRGPEAVAAFHQGLRSSDPAVRGYSAAGLGALAAAEALPDLLVALDRGVVEAAGAIGALRSGRVRRLHGPARALPFDVMTSGFSRSFSGDRRCPTSCCSRSCVRCARSRRRRR